MTPDLGEEGEAISDSDIRKAIRQPLDPLPSLCLLSDTACFPSRAKSSWRSWRVGAEEGGSAVITLVACGSLALPQELPRSVRKRALGVGPRSSPGPT